MDERQGPVYCEMFVGGEGWLFEPVNTWTNLAPIAAGLLALVMLWRWRPVGAVPWVMAGLLLATGIGSFVWHGFHSRPALLVETATGLLFFLCYLVWWARLAWGWLWGVVACILFLAIAIGQFFVLRPADEVEVGLRVIAVALVFGLALLWATSRRGFGAAVLQVEALALALAAAAAFFRTIDAVTCEVVPFGTHFLWHLLLALAAFTAIRAVVTANKADRGATHPIVTPRPAPTG